MDAQARRVFVAMPYGKKGGIDFDKVYFDYIKPALNKAGFDVFRGDEEVLPGSIHEVMFEDLLLADLVVADISLHNPNVWYELGVRHALRAQGVMQVRCTRDALPFDVQDERTLSYHVSNGEPDPEWLDRDMAALGAAAKEAVVFRHGSKASPVFAKIPFLKEPDWKSLREGKAAQYWAEYDQWERQVELARRRRRPGDILLLADEAPNRPLRLEAHRRAAQALLDLGHFQYALFQSQTAIEIEPQDLQSLQLKVIALGRLGKHDESDLLIAEIVRSHPQDAESRALWGRVKKDAWLAGWRSTSGPTEARKAAAARESVLLRAAIDHYVSGFKIDPTHFYSGINAVSLLHILNHLSSESPEMAELRNMEGGVRWAVASRIATKRDDYWAWATQGEIEVLTGSLEAIHRAYRKAVAAAQGAWFALDSSRRQLLILQHLGFRAKESAHALEILNQELDKLEAPRQAWEPRCTFLFSGHMIDAPDRQKPRFPPDRVDVAEKAISGKLDELGAGPQDLALCGGACGGDLLFAEQALARGMRLQVRIALPEPEFIQRSVAFAGESWTKRFFRVRNHENITLLVLPDELGPTPNSSTPFARNNLWQLYTALSHGPEKVRFICLWNRQGGDGPGGTEHMHQSVIQHSGQVHVLDTRALW